MVPAARGGHQRHPATTNGHRASWHLVRDLSTPPAIGRIDATANGVVGNVREPARVIDAHAGPTKHSLAIDDAVRCEPARRATNEWRAPCQVTEPRYRSLNHGLLRALDEQASASSYGAGRSAGKEPAGDSAK